jgi:ribonuclease HIII
MEAVNPMTKVFEATPQQIERIRRAYPESAFSAAPAYACFQVKDSGCTITAYHSGKVVFQGPQAEDCAGRFFPSQRSRGLILPQAGSDEVGTGDYFGPICVCAAYLDQDIYAAVKDLALIDSKQLTDPQIRVMGPELTRRVPHSLLILDNRRFNEVIATDNLNAIKAKMHNQAWRHLRDKGYPLPECAVVDDFCGEDNYYRYLAGEPEIIRGLRFVEKAENQFPAVACGAILSRYAFLLEMDELSHRYHCQIPKGAGKPVDEFGRWLVAHYGPGELERIAKLSFKNTKRILGG